MKIFNSFLSYALVIVCCTVHYHTFGQQNTSGKVIYKIGFSSNTAERSTRMKEASTNMGQEQDNFIAIMSEVNEKIEQYDFELQFNSSSSLYRLRNEVTGDNLSDQLAISTVGGNTIYFKDLKQRSRIEQRRYSGQLLNVIMEYDRFDWTITPESKMIDQYLCYKAKATMVFTGKFGEELSNQITAWFTTSIPAPYGPQGIDGLPGLILELSIGESDRYIYASKITLLPSSLEIKLPKGGKDIPHEEYQKILVQENIRRAKY